MMEDVGMQDVHFNEVSASAGGGLQSVSISEAALLCQHVTQWFSLSSCHYPLHSD